MATQPELVTAHAALILSLASKYVWWKTPEEAARFPERVIAQVMNLGHHTDVEVMVSQVGDALLIDVLTHAEVGQFTPSSWAYWHYRLGVVTPDEAVPPMPVRVLP